MKHMFSFDNFVTFTNIKLIYECLHNGGAQVLCDLMGPVSGSVMHGASTGN